MGDLISDSVNGKTFNRWSCIVVNNIIKINISISNINNITRSKKKKKEVKRSDLNSSRPCFMSRLFVPK